MSELPTREEMFERAVAELDKAYAALRDAADWLRSDWVPVGSSLTDRQAADRALMLVEIKMAMSAINWAKGGSR